MSSFPINSIVLLQNFTSEKGRQYNGMKGVVISGLHPASGRQGVLLVDGSKDKQKIAVKPLNMAAHPAARGEVLIVEMHNCAEFLEAVQKVLGSKGGVSKLEELPYKEDVISSKIGYIDNGMLTLNFNAIVGKPIGRKGVPVTIDDVLAMARQAERTSESGYCMYAVELLEAVKGMVGKDGPLKFEHGIVTASDILGLLVNPGQIGHGMADASGELLELPIGERGRKVTLDDIIDVFRKTSMHEELEKYRHSGRSYFFEGFEVTKDFKVLSTIWGS